MKQRIGFIGVGTMGKPMALNLLKAGYPLVVYDVNPKPMEELKAKGAALAQSSKEVASQSDVVITMVPKSEHVEAAILGTGGVLEGAKKGSIVIDTEKGPIALGEGQVAVIPKGLKHKPKADARAVILMIEPAKLKSEGI